MRDRLQPRPSRQRGLDSLGGWTDYARALQDAGAAAIELNIYYLPGDPQIPGRDVDSITSTSFSASRTRLTSRWRSSSVRISARPARSRCDHAAGADGLVLFNRFLQPDMDPERLAVVPSVALSNPADAGLARTWISLLHARVHAALAATSGVEEPGEVAK